MKRRMCRARIRAIEARAEGALDAMQGYHLREAANLRKVAHLEAVGALMNYLQETHHEACKRGGAILVPPPPPAQPFDLVVPGAGPPPAKPYHTLTLHADELLAWWMLLSRRFPNLIPPPQAAQRLAPFRETP